MAKSALVNTATLIRGRTYTIRSKKFERDVPEIIDDEDFLRELEEEVDEIPDGEGEYYDKPRFLIKRGVPAPEGSGVRRTRLSAEREIKTAPRKSAKKLPRRRVAS